MKSSMSECVSSVRNYMLREITVACARSTSPDSVLVATAHNGLHQPQQPSLHLTLLGFDAIFGSCGYTLKNDTDLVNLDMHFAKGSDGIERSLPS
jgi:hypothetical protein